MPKKKSGTGAHLVKLNAVHPKRRRVSSSESDGGSSFEASDGTFSSDDEDVVIEEEEATPAAGCKRKLIPKRRRPSSKQPSAAASAPSSSITAFCSSTSSFPQAAATTPASAHPPQPADRRAALAAYAAADGGTEGAGDAVCSHAESPPVASDPPAAPAADPSSCSICLSAILGVTWLSIVRETRGMRRCAPLRHRSRSAIVTPATVAPGRQRQQWKLCALTFEVCG